MKFRIELPIDAYMVVQDIQRRLLEREIDADQAGYEMAEALAPHVTRMPGPEDETDIVLKVKQRIFLTQNGPIPYLRGLKPPKESH